MVRGTIYGGSMSSREEKKHFNTGLFLTRGLQCDHTYMINNGELKFRKINLNLYTKMIIKPYENYPPYGIVMMNDVRVRHIK